MISDPNNFTPENPVEIFDQLLQTSAVMTYCQSFVQNQSINANFLNLLNVIQQIRLDLCIPPDYDAEEDCEIPFNLSENDLKYPQIS